MSEDDAAAIDGNARQRGAHPRQIRSSFRVEPQRADGFGESSDQRIQPTILQGNRSSGAPLAENPLSGSDCNRARDFSASGAAHPVGHRNHQGVAANIGPADPEHRVFVAVATASFIGRGRDHHSAARHAAVPGSSSCVQFSFIRTSARGKPRHCILTGMKENGGHFSNPHGTSGF
jgi:hypothetical protein